MFTGIIGAIGHVSNVERANDRLTITIRAEYADLVPGESIAVDGACLTVVEHGQDWFTVEAIVTTRGRTRFDELNVGDAVNLERALAVGDRFGGHIVQGHVDGVGTVRRVEAVGDAVLVDVAVPPNVATLCVPQGSIAVNGVSLTVNALPDPGTCQISLIPFTLDHTTLGAVRVGDAVHVEADLIGKYVRRLVEENEGEV